MRLLYTITGQFLIPFICIFLALMPLPLTVCVASEKSRLVLPFWYWVNRVVPEIGPLNGCVCYMFLISHMASIQAKVQPGVKSLQGKYSAFRVNWD